MKLRLALIAIVLLLISYVVGVRQHERWFGPRDDTPVMFRTAGMAVGPTGDDGRGPVQTPSLRVTPRVLAGRSPAAEAAHKPGAAAFLAAFEAELHAARARFGSEDPEGRRVGAPLVRLQRSRWLDIAARAHAGDMAARDYFAHESPEGEKAEHRVRRLAAWAMVLDTRENLAFVQTSQPLAPEARAREAMQGLMDSPGHRGNILNANSTHVGLGVASVLRDGLYEEYAVQVFGIEVGEWSGGPPLVGPVSSRPLNLTVRLDRRDVEFLLTNPSRPQQRYRDLANPRFEYRGSVPVRLNAAGNALVLPPLAAGRYTLNARLLGAGEGFYEIAAFEIR